MKEMVMRFSGGKDSTLAAIQVLREYDRLHLLTFHQAMIANVEKSAVNVEKLRQFIGDAERVIHHVVEMDEPLQFFYQGKGYLHDLRHYGTLARAPLCTACDFTMIVLTLKYCLEHGIKNACDGGNKGEFAGFLDEWGTAAIQAFARKYGIVWDYPVYNTARCDVELLEIGLAADAPILFSRSQASCRGGGLFANIHLRCYFLPVHGPDRYRAVTLAWLDERMEMAHVLLSRA